MDTATSPASATPDPAASRHTLLLAAFTAAIFASAALLFAVQPMFAKMVLPKLGGAPSVWSVAMVFFQTALLAGYAYAHLLTRFAPGRMSVPIHLAVMVVACFALPLAIASGWGRPPAQGEAFWLLGLFAVSIGLPFFALSANSSLLQAWFARTDHPAARDPYFLYAASNIGSFLALVTYPAAVEPLLRLGDQTWLWSLGFYLLIAMIAVCGLLLWRTPTGAATADAPAATDAAESAPPTWRDVATWVALAAVPSGLLVAVTAHISTDVAAVPLLWVLPLALYLVTFVIVFQSKPLIPHWLVVEAQPAFIIGFIAVLIFEPIRMIVWQVAIHLVVFFVCTLVCHGELARRRPAARYLTSFYMWMSAGGMIGGIAAALIAPRIFNWIAEYPILIVAAVLCRPGLSLPKGQYARIGLFGGILLGVLALICYKAWGLDIDETTFHYVVAGLLILSVLFWRHPLPFAAVIAFILAAQHVVVESGSTTVRSFFGVHKITESSDGRFRLLSHGTTLHGGQRIRDAEGKPLTERPAPTMYYYDGSALAQTLDAARARGANPLRFAVIGLGTGSLVCRAEPNDKVDFYEIDPATIRIARDPERFTFISTCRPDVPIILGDARLTMEDAVDGSYDVIIVDAFSSDAIPIHLMTREAMAIYAKKLAPRGMVVFHISNRHLELASVVTGIAAANGFVTRLNEGTDVEEDDSEYKFLSTVAAVARNDEDFGTLAKSQHWELQQPNPKLWVWTDDYSNVVGAVIRQLRN